ncbi:hypothetical protein MB27_07485 [Actinoplanes utahensis]|uniref:Peptidase S9 prolyl oligopeptidase catalytic domain-containing protein n=1 Tax=Actinoplanes utahensis TaxID=1869 RepID=A0A0A6USU4_ACTUT|nr:hypothetical protein MB27_07485 [Actinoplanes utahensis]
MVTAVLVALAVTAPAPAHADTTTGTGDVIATAVDFTGAGGVTLHGTVLTPATPAGPARRPAIVMLEGAGNRGRDYLMPEARAYARHGITTLVYDKRTDGYSMLDRDYGLLADDALAGLRMLRSRPDVDPERAGLWGLSEGAFVAPIAANRSDDVKFLITVGAVGVTPAEQTAWAYGTYLRHAGVGGSLPDTMRGVTVRTAIGAGIFSESGFDPVPHWERVRQPVLAQWGRLDRDAVPGESSRLIRGALERGGNTRHTVRIVDGVNHNLHRTADDGFDRLPGLPAGYGDVEARWIADPAPGTVPAGDFGAEPAAPAIGDPAWYESPVILLVALLAMVAALIIRPRVRGLRAARWLAVLGPVTVAGTLLYLLALLATAAKVTGPVLLGRPVVWLVLQALACATVAATVAVGYHLLRHRPAQRIRPGLLLAAGLLFIPWAVQWGLLIP